MPALPSISPGGGGPSSASGGATGGGGLDGSGWSVNFGGMQAIPAAIPHAVAYRPADSMLPGMSAISAGITASTSQAAGLSPVVLLGAGLVVLAMLRKRHA